MKIRRKYFFMLCEMAHEFQKKNYPVSYELKEKKRKLISMPLKWKMYIRSRNQKIGKKQEKMSKNQHEVC